MGENRSEPKEIQQINFIDCMCNAGVYKDGDACTALEVIEDFNGLAKQFPSKKFSCLPE